MADINRTIQELLSDYAGALRDGCVPVFLKSLTRQEGQTITSCGEFWDATQVVRALNGVGFADKAITADVGLFISRVDAKIASRLKKAKTSPRRSSRRRPSSERRALPEHQRTEETL
jgi:hypothetical protein